ncbi:efflux RND transporter permease subunit [Natroniella sulfidigena]|uniref:efflux RND transporter permease subunit n=1 Tax=Natroniella sulfidigena TaxID=723921 RepID=UPI00200A21F9|nr:efflux RND transporter permease subunit [Natroniella sulfidigena]MCK8815777.1 efflux RND transporter permease subunit [Natroniella sulfidigena]
MKLSDFSVDRSVTITMIVLAIIILGAFSLPLMPVDLMPEMDLPYAVVMTTHEGATPSEVEESITRPIEETIAVVDNVTNITSSSHPNRSVVFIEFDWGTDLDFATLDMRESVEMIEDHLPDDADKPQVVRFDPNSMPIMNLELGGDMDLAELRNLAEDIVEPSLERVPGVASVDVSGGLEREIQVDIDPDRMIYYGFSLQDVIEQLRAENVNISGGSVDHGTKDLLIRTDGEFDSVEQIGDLQLMNQEGVKVDLAEFAEVKDDYKERSVYSYLNGEESISLEIQDESGGNTVQIANAVLEEVEQIQNNEDDFELTVVENQAEFIEDSIANVQRNAVLGGLLAMLVLFLFLRNIRSTLIVGTAIPVSIVTAIVLMYFADMSLNLMSLGGLALGIGMLVDNAIVVLENIYRFQQEGKSRVDAAKKGTAEVGTAILASTLTTAAVFLPVVYIEGLASEIFGALAWSVTFSLVASLLVALTFIPMLSAKFLKVNDDAVIEEDETEVEFGWIRKGYQRFLDISLNYRYLVLASLVIFVLLFGFGVARDIIPLETEFLPDTDQGVFNIQVELPEGEALRETDRVVQEVERRLEEIPELRHYSSQAGGNNSNTGEITAELVGLADRERSTSVVAEEVRGLVADIAGADINVTPVTGMGGGGGMGAPIEVTIAGSDLDILSQLADQIEPEVEAVEGTRNVGLSIDEGRPEVQIDIDRDQARDLGFNVQQIASTVRTAMDGQVATQYKEGGEEFDVRVRLAEEYRGDINQLMDLKLTSPEGAVVPLSQVANVEVATGLTSIERENQQRTITVSTHLHERSLGAVQADIEERVDQLDIPDGYTVSYGGEAEDQQDAFGDLGIAMILAVILVYMVMASQFESLLHPFTIMLTVPLALIGAILGLVVARMPLSVPGIIGVIMLAGIVVNNAIVMVDYINVRREREPRREAILNAGPIRLRPVMMTTLTTALALVPLALGLGDGAEVQQPMAVVVISGLLFSTILTLVVIPCFYSILDDLSNFLKRLLRIESEEELTVSN